MSNTAVNPLHKHFRQASIYIKLPSQGRFYPENTLDTPVTGEIPVYPMTVRDELTLKTPDALMNGAGMIEVVKSCCPSIREPWEMPAIDVDTVFIAIRLASYGEGMDITSRCPHCDENNEHTIDLRTVLDRVQSADYDDQILIDGLWFTFKPQKYKDINQLNMIAYEEQRIIDSIVNNETLNEQQKKERFNVSFQKLKEMNIGVLINNIQDITTKEGVIVSDPKMIKEFLENCSRLVYEQIKKQIQVKTDVSKLPPIDLSCDACTKDYSTNLEFDQSNFFE